MLVIRSAAVIEENAAGEKPANEKTKDFSPQSVGEEESIPLRGRKVWCGNGLIFWYSAFCGGKAMRAAAG